MDAKKQAQWDNEHMAKLKEETNRDLATLFLKLPISLSYERWRQLHLIKGDWITNQHRYIMKDNQLYRWSEYLKEYCPTNDYHTLVAFFQELEDENIRLKNKIEKLISDNDALADIIVENGLV